MLALPPSVLSRHDRPLLSSSPFVLQLKMSKADKDSAIFMEDPASEVERKLMSAYCPKAEDGAATAVAAEVRL